MALDLKALQDDVLRISDIYALEHGIERSADWALLKIQEELKQTTLLITHNITEAVQLSDRVIIMTFRPGKVKRIVDIRLPRPRTGDVVGSDAFGRHVAEIWNDLREEASRGMAESEAGARRGRG